MVSRHRVLVIGGGPAGSTCAALLAKEGHDVTLFERVPFPRHHIGESLQPAAFDLLELHLGLKKKIAALGFQRKYGALYRWGTNNELWSVLFDPRLENDLPTLNNSEDLAAGAYDHAWHVRRDEFDQLLLETAISHGAKHVLASVAGVDVRDGRVVGLTTEDGTSYEADWVIDASGQSAVVARQLGHLRQHDDLKAVSTYGYFEGDVGLEGALGREATYICSVPEGWIWWIPVGPSRTSVGLVTLDRSALPRGPEGRQMLLDAARKAGLPVEETLDVHGVSPLHGARDWSYSVSTRRGPGWIAIGDAAGFVDPILSGGTDFAIRDACNAALALLRIADDPVGAEAVLDEYADRAQREFQAYVKLARYWYGNNRSVDGFFWRARREIQAHSEFVDTPLRAFVYLTSGQYSADRHYKVFIDWQEKRIFEQLGVNKPALQKAMKHLRKPR